MPKIKTEDNKEHEEEQTKQISNMLANPPSEEEEQEKPKGESEDDQEQDGQEPEGNEQEEPESSEQQEEEEQAEEASQEETIQRLRNQLEKVSGGQGLASQGEPEGGTQSGEEEDRPKDPRGEGEQQPSKKEIEKEAEDIDIQQIVTPEEFEEMQTDPKKFNEVLARVYKAAESNARQKMMQDVPQLVQKTASRQATYQTAVQNFYDENPDLKPFKKFVSVTMNEVAAENPDMNLEEMLQETAKRARKNLALADNARDKEKERREQEDGGPSDKPAFAGGSKGGRSGGGEDIRSDQQKQIDDLI